MKVKNFLAIVFISCLCSSLAAQKSPYHIRNFSASEYGGFNQMWQCLQDDKGLIHVASTSAMFSYDGTRWYGTTIKKGAATRQILFDTATATIYAGSVSDFGYLEPDSIGSLVYKSFVDQLTPEQAIFTDVWKMCQVGKRIYFQSSERIFVVEDKKVIGAIEPWEEKSFALMFCVGNRIYVRQRETGIMEIQELKMTLVPNSEIFANERLLGMMAYTPDTTLMLTGDHGFVKMGGVQSGKSSFTWFPVANDTFLTTTAVLGCEWISENEFAVNSRIGLMIYTRNFIPKVLFNKKSGLADESIAEFFVDREKNIWIATNNGCSMISYQVPAVTYTDESGFAGSLEMMVFSGDTMYLATSEGLYQSVGRFAHGQPMTFSRLDLVRTEVWDIHDAGSSLLLSTSQGVFEHRNGKTTGVTNWYTNECRPTDDGIKFMTAEKGGLSVLRCNANGFYSSMSFELPGVELLKFSPIRAANGDTSHYIFSAQTRFKTIMAFDLNIRDSTLSTREFGPENGIPANDYYAVILGDTIYYLGYYEAYRYVPSYDVNDSAVCFFPAPDIYELLVSAKVAIPWQEFNYSLFLDKTGDSYTTFFGRHDQSVYGYPVLIGDLFKGNYIQFGMVTGDSVLWILGKQELMQYDLANPIDTGLHFRSLICNVKFTGDSVGLYFPLGETVIPYSHNSVIFQFAAPYYLYSMSVQFQYKLEGYDENWSKFTSVAEKEYTNLPEGTYTFVVRAENAFSMISNEARYTFTILPPWYRTTWAYAIYAFAVIAFLFITVRLNTRRLLKQKEKLEQIVTERTAEVVQQKQQIESQKVDLEVAYTGIQDSIHYSQRIQQAILPTNEDISKIVPDCFVLFYPRDIVSGDFYWFAEKSGMKFVACVDCTGHGVPGALMSMIGNTLLNQIVIEKNITSPEEILNQLHLGVRHALKQDAGGDTRDGMDIALITLSADNKVLTYAGANRNLWIVRNNELLETKADKFPIAGSQQVRKDSFGETEHRFTKHEIRLEKNDCIYLTTDGYADQFGGPKGKKFMVKQLTKMLVAMSGIPLQEQKTALAHKFSEWRGTHEQVDDVLVIGIRV